MANENFTKYTEVDVPDHITLTAAKAAWNAQIRNEDTRAYKDYGAGHFLDFRFDFEIEYTDVEAGDVSESMINLPFTVSNSPGDWTAIWASDTLTIYADQDGNTDDRIRYWLFARTGGATIDSDMDIFRDIAKYYCTIYREGAVFTCDFYSDAPRTILVFQLTCACHVTALRYIVVGCSRNGIIDPNDHSTGYIQNLDLNDAVDLPAEFIVRNIGVANLPVQFEVGIPHVDLFCKFEVGQGAVDLPAEFAISGESWLEHFVYRKNHKINGSVAGVQTDYQVSVTVHYGAGADSGDDVYCDSKCKTDFGDIRFTSWDGETELDYWMEKKVDSDNAVFWIKVPSIPASPATTSVYIYYGNAAATTTSNIYNTFVIGDDFEECDLARWVDADTAQGISSCESDQKFEGTYSYRGYDSAVAGHYARITQTLTARTNLRVWGTLRVPSEQATSMAVLFNNGTIRLRWRLGATSNLQYYDGAAWQTVVGAVIDTWYQYLLIYKDTDRFDLYFYNAAGTQIGSALNIANFDSTGSVNLLALQQAYATGFSGYAWQDIVRLGEYCSPEPAHGAWGGEEEQTGSADLPAEFIVRQEVSVDLPAEFEVGQGTVNLKASFDAQASVSLFCTFVVGQGAEDLLAGFFVNAAAVDLPAGFAIPGESWLAGWLYRKSHKITGSTVGAQTDYQVGVKVYYGAGVDGTETVNGVTFGKIYCDSKCKTDFGDIRFTSWDGITEIDYWLQEKSDSSYALFWVEVPYIPASPAQTTIYVYYGDPPASTTSDGDATFPWFDHFDDADITTDYDITKDGADTITEAGTLLTFTSSHVPAGHWTYVTKKVALSVNHLCFVARARRSSWDDGWEFMMEAVDSFFTDGAIFMQDEDSTVRRLQERDGGGGLVDNQDDVNVINDTNYHIVSLFYRYDIGAFGIYDSGVALTNAFAAARESSPTLVFGQSIFTAAGINNVSQWDWIFARKYESPEPAHGTWGAEEVQSYSVDLPAEFLIINADTVDLPAQFTVRQGILNLPAQFFVRNAGVANLPAQFIVAHFLKYWAKDSDNYLVDPGDNRVWPATIHAYGLFHLFMGHYTAGSDITYRTSNDGERFTVHASSPVITRAEVKTAWSLGTDIDALEPHSIIWWNGKHRMYFGAHYASDSHWRIGWAESDDLENWTISTGPSIVASQGWENNECADPHAVVFNGLVYVFYAGKRAGPDWDMGVAWSADGDSFTKSTNNPILALSVPMGFSPIGTPAYGATAIIQDRSVGGYPYGAYFTHDGETFAAYPGNPVMVRNAGIPWESVNLGHASLCLVGSEYWLYYCARDGADDFRLGRAGMEIGSESLPASFWVNQGVADLPAQFFINVPYVDLHGEFVVRHSDAVDLPAEFLVAHIASEDLLGVFIVRNEDIVDLPAEFIVRREASVDLAAEFVVRQETSIDLPAEFDVQHLLSGSVDLPAQFIVLNTGTANLLGEFVIRRTALPLNLAAEFIVRHSSSVDLAAEFIVQHAAAVDLLGEFFIINIGTADLLGEFVIRHEDSLDLPAQFEVGQGATDLLGTFVIRHSAALNLPAQFIVRHSSSVDLDAEFIVQHIASADLPASFWVNYYSVDLFAKFNVRQTSSRATDFEIIDNTRGLTIHDADREMTVTPRRRMRVR